MKRFFVAVFLLAWFPLPSQAGDEIVRLKVRSMAAPQPALKYLLLPEVREMSPGNPAQWYMRCFAEQRNFFFTKYSAAQRARFLSMPLAELRAQKIQRYGGSALTQADWAARLNAIDWQVLERVQSEGMDLRLSELEPLKILATALKARFRIEIAREQFDDAIRTAKTMFALARHLGDNPTPEANQVGLFVATLALDALEEMIQQPGCPNLYWAITDLPTPLVDLRKGFQGKRKLMETEFRALRFDTLMSAEELEKVVSRLSGVTSFAQVQAGKSSRSLRAGLAERLKDTKRVGAIRDHLVEVYRNKHLRRYREQNTTRALFDNVIEMTAAMEMIRKMPPAQLILLDEQRKFEFQSDERLKLLTLAPWQIDRLGGAELECGGNCLLSDLLPQVAPVRREQARLEQRIALLRHVEALRLYAAGHDGKVPEKLIGIAVPLPNDPFTGKPFGYEIAAASVRLSGGASQREEKNAASKICYEVTLKK